MSLVAVAARHAVVRAALEEAGWHDTHEFDAAELIRGLQSEGFSVSASATEALRELGGLRITPPRRSEAAFASGEIVMQPLFAASGEVERIRVRESTLGSTLCPIGEWMGEYILLVGDDGTVWAETTFEMRRVGEDMAEALRTMILAESLPERHE